MAHFSKISTVYILIGCTKYFGVVQHSMMFDKS